MYWQKRLIRKNPDWKIEAEMLRIREKYQHYGYRRITQEMKKQGFSINKKRVQRLVQKLNLQVEAFTRKSRRYNSYRGKIGIIAPNRDLVAFIHRFAIKK